MQFLRTLSYIVAAIVVVGVLTAGAGLLMAIVTIAGLILCVITVVGFVAYCIKEYCEN